MRQKVFLKRNIAEGRLCEGRGRSRVKGEEGGREKESRPPSDEIFCLEMITVPYTIIAPPKWSP